MQSPPSYRFGNTVIDAAERRVEVGGRPARLGGRAFVLLLARVERRDRVVSKNELLDIVWPKLVVEENNLQVQVGALRKLLGPHAIATIPGRGYRFAQPLPASRGSRKSVVRHAVRPLRRAVPSRFLRRVAVPFNFIASARLPA